MSEADAIWFVGKLFLAFGSGWITGFFILQFRKSADTF